MVQWLRAQAPNAGDRCSIPGQGTNSPMLQLKPGAATQIDILLKEKKTVEIVPCRDRRWSGEGDPGRGKSPS